MKKFFWDMSGRFDEKSANSKNRFRFIIPIVFALAVCIFITLSLSGMKSEEDKLIGAYTIRSIQKNNDSIPFKEGAFTKEAMLFFEFGGACLLSVNDSSYYGNYEHTGNKLMISLKKKNSLFKDLNGTLDNTTIKGQAENGASIKINLQAIKNKGQN